MFIAPAYAQAATGQGSDLFVSLLPLVLIFIVFYFLLIRPQQQKLKAHRALIEGIKKGDQVLTAGGIMGKVTRVEADSTVMVEIAPTVVVKVAKGTISDLVNKPVPASSNDNSTAGAAKAADGSIGGMLGRLFKR